MPKRKKTFAVKHTKLGKTEPDVWGANPSPGIGVKLPKKARKRNATIGEKSRSRLKLPTSEKTRRLYKIIAVR